MGVFAGPTLYPTSIIGINRDSVNRERVGLLAAAAPATRPCAATRRPCSARACHLSPDGDPIELATPGVRPSVATVGPVPGATCPGSRWGDACPRPWPRPPVPGTDPPVRPASPARVGCQVRGSVAQGDTWPDPPRADRRRQRRVPGTAATPSALREHVGWPMDRMTSRVQDGDPPPEEDPMPAMTPDTTLPGATRRRSSLRLIRARIATFAFRTTLGPVDRPTGPGMWTSAPAPRRQTRSDR